MNDKNKINCKFINGKVRNMELPILLKEKLEQEIDEIELKKLKQSANIEINHLIKWVLD